MTMTEASKTLREERKAKRDRYDELRKTLETREWNDEEKAEADACAEFCRSANARIEALEADLGSAPPAPEERTRTEPGSEDRSEKPEKRQPALPKPFGTLKHFKGEDGERQAHYCSLWLRSKIRTNPELAHWSHQRIKESDWEHRDFDEVMPETRAQSGGSPTAGGYLVPEPLLQRLIQIREEAGIRGIADVIPMSQDTLKIPKETSGHTVYYPGQTKAITASDAAVEQVQLTVKDSAVLSKVANQLIADSPMNALDRFIDRAAYEMVWQEDGEIVLGDGTSTYGGETGILNAVGSTSTNDLGSGDTTWSTVVLADFTDTMALVHPMFWRDQQMNWLMRRDFWAQVVQGLQAAAGGNTMLTLASGARVPQFLGYPIRFTSRLQAEAVSTVPCAFGNFMAGVAIGDRQTIAVAQSTDFAFDENVTTFRLTSRCDVNVHQPGDGSTKGAVALMKLAAS